MKKGIFQSFDEFIDKMLIEFIDVVQSALATGIGTILSMSILIYIIYYGYLIMAGKVQAPVQDFVWDFCRLGLIVMFLQNAGGLLDQTAEAVKGLSTLGVPDGNSGLGFIDDQMNKIKVISEEASDLAPWGAGWFVSGSIWAGFILAVFPAVIIILKAKFTLFFLLAFAPIFIFCLMWGWLKESFNNYLSALLSNALIVIAVTTLFSAVITFFFDKVKYNGENAFMFSAIMILIGLFNSALVAYIYTVVGSLMRVSIEKAPRSISQGLEKYNNYRSAKRAQNQTEKLNSALEKIANK